MNSVRNRVGGLVVAFAALASLAVAALGSASASAAGLHLEPEVLELPDMVEGEAREVSFTLHNDGPEARHITVKTSCACSTPLAASLDVEPGRSVAVPVRVDTRISPGGNTAAVQIQEGNAIVAESMLTFRSSPELVAEPSMLRMPHAAPSTTADLHCIGTRLPDELEVLCAEPALDVRLARKNTRRWHLEVRRLPRERATRGPIEVVVVERGNKHVLTRIPIAVSNLPEAELRVATTPETGDAGDRRLWVLLEGFAAKPPRVVAVSCGDASMRFQSEAGSDREGPASRAHWISLRYREDQAGRTASLRYETASGMQVASVELP